MRAFGHSSHSSINLECIPLVTNSVTEVNVSPYFDLGQSGAQRLELAGRKSDSGKLRG